MESDFKKDLVEGYTPIIVGFIVAAVFCFLLCGCKPTKEIQTETQIEKVEVPVPVIQEHHTENVRVDIVRDTIRQRDSVVYRDSVYHYVKGDTTIIERWHYITSNHHLDDNSRSMKVDTVVRMEYIEKPVVVEKEKVKTVTQEVEVEKKLNKWQQFKMDTGGLMLALLGIAAVAFGVWGFLRLKKKIKI